MVRRFGQRAVYRQMRIYRSLRSAHLERAHVLPPATIAFSRRRDDFDEDLTGGLDIIQSNVFSLFCTVLRSAPELIEINEPLMRDGLQQGLVAIAAARLSGLLRSQQVQIVTYAIENRNPFALPSNPRLRTRLHTVVDRIAATVVARQVNRIAFGTEGARIIYQQVLADRLRRVEMSTIPALPATCDCPPVTRLSDQVVFVGALEVRKGFPALTTAWPHVVEQVPGARLTVIGKGPLEPLAADLAGSCPGVELCIDPPRAVIHRELRKSAVLVLLSTPTEHWREQVGLPITEALSHGCAVLTTDQTGLAGWLAAHGHVVIDPAADPAAVAGRLVGMLRAGRTAESVLADLPAGDGRLKADEWMFTVG